MDLIFQFLRIMVFCFAGELCYNFLPLPIPASVYGLLLLLAALKLGWVKLEQVRTAALFLIGIFPLLFVPAAAGVMDQFGHSGPAAEVLRDYGLTAENIVSAVREMVRPDQPAAE